jgi:hypothetical protein
MPYMSRAQQGWAHTAAGTKALGGPAKVAEWDSASKGMKLPKRVAKPKVRHRDALPKSAGHIFGSLAPDAPPPPEE